jgi:hypothetical protein
MKQPVLLSLLGITAYVLFLLLTLPMSLALNWSGKLPEEVTTYGVEGSILDGSADALIWQSWRFDRLHWQFAQLQLLSGRLGYQLRFTNPDGNGSATVGMGLGNSVHFDQLALRLPLPWLAGQWSLSPRFGGEVEAELAEFSIEDGRITAANGALLWSAAHLRGEPPTALGSFRAELQPVAQHDGTVYRGPISDNGGPLGASGQFELTTDGLWQIRSKLALRDGGKVSTNPALVRLFSSMGAAGADGKVDFKLQGQLPLPQPQTSADQDTEHPGDAEQTTEKQP